MDLYIGKTMFIRVFIIKFPNENKKELAATFIESLKPRFDKESKILDFQTLDIGEGKLLNIARYKNKVEFEETNKWLAPEFTSMIKELDGVVESIPGEVIFTYSRQINNK